MRNIFKFHLLLLCLYSHLSCAHQYEFNDLVVFGDSLSDMGNIAFISETGQKITSKQVAGNMPIYNEYLAKIFTGKAIYPALLGGTNYANNSAVVYADDIDNADAKKIAINTVFNSYLTTNKIIPNNLYIMWGGGNDLDQGFFNSLINITLMSTIYAIPNLFFDTVNAIGEFVYYDYWDPNPIAELKKQFSFDPILNSNYSFVNTDIADMAKKLIDKGAKYVMVPNLFDTGLVPMVFFGLPAALHNILGNYLLSTNPSKINELIFNIINYPLAKISQTYYEYFNQKNNIPDNNYTGSGKEFILNNFKLKYGALSKIILTISKLLSITTQNFNYYLDKQLQELNDHIIYLDIYSLFNEIIDNPKFYGFDDILLPTCSGLASAYECYPNQENIYHAQKIYLWSDNMHPSAFMHMIFAQYMASVFNAPVLVSSISRQLENFNLTANDYLFNQLINLNPTEHKIEPFISISGTLAKIGHPYNYASKSTNTNSLNLGLSYGLNHNLALGSMLSASFGNYQPFDNFKYKYNAQLINIFAKYNINSNCFLSSSLNIGRISANNIRRIIQLGNAKLIQNSNTHAKTLGLNLTSAYNFELNHNINLTPYLSFNLNNYKINAFAEKNHNSTAMQYAKTSTTNKNIKVALNLNQHNNTLYSFFEFGITNHINNKPIKIKSSLNTTKVSFIREIYLNDKPSFNIATGFNKTLKHNLLLNANLNYKFNNHYFKQLNYSIGLNMKF